jgi:hypothetical protein
MFLPHTDLTEKIIGCAYTVHHALGAEFLEKVYENSMARVQPYAESSESIAIL